MISNEDIYFDAQSGISIEEQKEILAQINGITEKNKKSLLDAAEGLHNKENMAASAKKKGILFPLAVNIAALLVLALTAFFIWDYNHQKDFEIRTGTGSYSMAGQAVIGELTAAQEEAMETLRQLSREQERAAGIDAYLSGGIAVITQLVLDSQFDRALETAGELRLFLDTASFEANRPFMSRKEFYVQAIDSVYKLIDDIRKAGGNYIVELETKNTQLEESITEMQRSLDALSEGSGGQARRIIQLEDNITEKDRTIASLETERDNLLQTVSDLRSVNAEQDAQILQLNDQLTNIRQILQALSQ